MINEFASIEQLIALPQSIEFKEYFVSDIIEYSIDLLIDDESCVEVEIKDDKKIKVHFKLFAIALKNLLDNGIKYSNDKKVKLIYKDGDFIIINYSKPLLHDLEYYFEPFSKDHSNSQSFGLGLYIVHHILKLHGSILKYNNNDNINIFTVRRK